MLLFEELQEGEKEIKGLNEGGGGGGGRRDDGGDDDGDDHDDRDGGGGGVRVLKGVSRSDGRRRPYTDLD